MKVIVNISYCAKAEVKGCDSHGKRLSFAVKPSYTVKRLKQQVMLVESLPFPEQVLELNGMVLADSQRLDELAVTEGQELDLKVTATVAVFTQQLVDLLKEQTHPVSATELAMLYSHKSGGTVKRALSILGCGSNLIDYISSESKQFSIESGMVSLIESTITNVAEDEKPLALATEVVIKSTLGNVVKASLELTVLRCETVQGFADRVAAAELIPFQAVEVSMKGQVLEGSQTLGFYIKEASTVHVQINISKALLLQQLAGLLNGRCLSVTELGDLYCYRYGAPVTRALELVTGTRSTLKDFLKDNLEHFSLHAGSVKQREASNNPTVRTTTFGALNQRYLDLDSEITSCKSIEEAEACFELALQSVAGGSHGIKRVIRGGSLGRGTAFAGNADAEALLLLNGTSPMDRATWLPPLLMEMASTLRKDMTGKADVSVVDDTIHLSFPGSTVVLSFDALSGPLALAAERRARLFAKMSPATKVTMRLLKWWRNQQNWSNECRPCDLVLEELVASTANTSPEDQADAVATVLGALESMDKQAYEESSSPRGYFDNHQLIQLAAQSAGKLIDVK